MEATKR